MENKNSKEKATRELVFPMNDSYFKTAGFGLWSPPIDFIFYN